MSIRGVATLALPAALLPAVLLLGGCSTAAPDDGGETPPGLAGELTIYAAASLGAAFDELAARFEEQNLGVDVLPIVYDGSSTLATQLVEGAQADVFAAADEATMTAVADAGLVDGEPTVFAGNTLRIAVPPGNPGGVEGLADLARPGLAVVLCAPAVPCGAASATLLGNAGVAVTAASEEQNVSAVLAKVQAGEADAGLVYATDVAAAGDAIEAITPAGADAVVNRYPVAALLAAPNPRAARAFVELVTGPVGRQVLAAHGFRAP